MQHAPASAASQEIRLTQEQSLAIDELMNFLANPNPPDNFFVLSGFAGTGKTFCMREVLSRSRYSRSKFAFTAPTNKAAKVLRQITGEACTIYSLLGLRIDKSGELKKLSTATAKPTVDISEFDAVFVDEGSMVNAALFSILRKHEVKVVFMGDAAQLPPVGEVASKIWTSCKSGVKLTKVMRHDNQILRLVTSIRDALNSMTPSIKIESDHAGNEGVWKMAKAAFKKSIFEAAEAGEFADGSNAKVIAWRNVRVSEYNDLIRRAIWGGAADQVMYMPGERLVASEPCLKGEDVLLTTDEEAIVESAVVCKHPMEPKYSAIELLCRSEANIPVRLLVLHPESQALFNADSEQLAHEAKANPKLWRKFWLHKELFHSVKYAYALTAHRSQGSTYQSVWVDYQDILLNRNRHEAFQCLYVACSRPTTKLILA